MAKAKSKQKRPSIFKRIWDSSPVTGVVDIGATIVWMIKGIFK